MLRSKLVRCLASPAAAVGLVALLALGCEGMGTGASQPASAWSQQAVTQLASQLATQMSDLYTSAEKEPAFAGERSAYTETLDNLRILKEESAGLKQELEDGKMLDETRARYERIEEAARDASEAETSEFLPPEFTAKAKTAFGVLAQLGAYYGSP